MGSIFWILIHLLVCVQSYTEQFTMSYVVHHKSFIKFERSFVISWLGNNTRRRFVIRNDEMKSWAQMGFSHCNTIKSFYSGPQSRYLQHIQVPIIPLPHCKQAFARMGVLKSDAQVTTKVFRRNIWLYLNLNIHNQFRL